MAQPRIRSVDDRQKIEVQRLPGVEPRGRHLAGRQGDHSAGDGAGGVSIPQPRDRGPEGLLEAVQVVGRAPEGKGDRVLGRDVVAGITFPKSFILGNVRVKGSKTQRINSRSASNTAHTEGHFQKQGGEITRAKVDIPRSLFPRLIGYRVCQRGLGHEPGQRDLTPLSPLPGAGRGGTRSKGLVQLSVFALDSGRYVRKGWSGSPFPRGKGAGGLGPTKTYIVVYLAGVMIKASGTKCYASWRTRQRRPLSGALRSGPAWSLCPRILGAVPLCCRLCGAAAVF